MAQPETLLVNEIKRAVKRTHPTAMIVKLAGGIYQSAGLPDLLVVLNGRAYFFEVKKQRLGESEQHARERATLRQEARLTKLREAGAVAAVVLSATEVLDLLANS